MIDSSNHEAFTKKEKIRVEKIDPVLERNDLNELCNQITSLKRNKIEQTTFEEKMLHDANCLHYLYEEEKGFAAPKLFITCDFNLARIRKFSDYGNSIITVNELYDFLLPYLLISDDNFTNPDRLPNMLLETAIDLELGDSICLEEIVGNFVKNKPDGLNYKILNSTMMSEKFEQIKKKNSIIQSSNFTEDECTIKLDENFNNFENDYIEAVKKDTIQCLREYKYSDIDEIIADSKKKLSEKDAEIITLKAKLDKLEKKEKKREKYQKKMKNQSLKPKKRIKKREGRDNNMHGEAKLLLKFLDGSDNRYIIPVYQRNYDWRPKQCEQLFNDLVQIIKKDRKSHFFGSIVTSSANKGGKSDYLVIDGQQRITT